MSSVRHIPVSSPAHIKNGYLRVNSLQRWYTLRHSRCLINCCRITEQMPQRMVPAHSHWSFPKAWGPFPSCPRTCPFGLAALLTLVADLSINVVGKAAVEDLIPTTCLGSGEQTIALLPSFLPRKDCEWPGGSSQM